MGGSGGGSGASFGDLEEFRKRTREELEKAKNRRNVFISFDADDKDSVNLLRGQAANDMSEVEFNDWSVKVPYDSENADYIRRRIEERIRQCSVTVVYVSDKTAASKWVNWEVEKSKELGKTIVAVYAGDKPPRKLPTSVAVNGDKIRVIAWRDLAAFVKNL